jgi:hypothetical protein
MDRSSTVDFAGHAEGLCAGQVGVLGCAGRPGRVGSENGLRVRPPAISRIAQRGNSPRQRRGRRMGTHFHRSCCRRRSAMVLQRGPGRLVRRISVNLVELDDFLWRHIAESLVHAGFGWLLASVGVATTSEFVRIHTIHHDATPRADPSRIGPPAVRLLGELGYHNEGGVCGSLAVQ